MELSLTFVFRVDASMLIGTGHLMRCLALASTMRTRGHKAIFVMRELPGHLADVVMTSGFETRLLPWIPGCDYSGTRYEDWLGVPWEVDAQESFAAVKDLHADALVVDHYSLDQRWEHQLQPLVRHIFVIDDLANRPHACSVLLDSNLAENPERRYDRLVTTDTTQLLGPNYVLLRSEFLEARTRGLRYRTRPIRKILVSFGGVDLNNMTEIALRAITTTCSPNIETDIVLGPRNPHKQAITALSRGISTLHIHDNPPHMADLILKADLAVGASGSSTWERCCLGLPAIVMALADNQVVVGESSQRNGLAVYLGPAQFVSVPMISDAIQEFQITDQLAQMSRQASNSVDGRGSERVLQALLQASSKAA